ncbi:MAG: amidase [Proteobacteria bacterium]|nr:amidase [Pseudomonadota bacterium]
MAVTPLYDIHNHGMRPFHTAISGFLDGSDSPRDYLERCIEVIDAREPELQAFVSMNLAAARTAADASSARYKVGKPLSVVDGMPIGIKDVIETEDFPTEFGSAMFKNWQADWDAACIYWLKQGGAIGIGKTVTTEFATRPPGPTRNPWDLARTPGGSSSGSAAAVGAAMLPVGLGTQVRGSVLRPAAYCGNFGVKPSLGVINLQGIMPFSRGINHLGALAASLEDAWLTLHYISRTGGGEFGHDCLPGPTEVPDAKSPSKIAVLETIAWNDTPAASKQAFDQLLATLRTAGIEIVGRRDEPEVETLEKMFEEVPVLSDTLRDWEGRYPLLPYGDRDASLLHEETRARLDILRALKPEDYAEALKTAEAMRRHYAKLADKVDACITLTAPGPAELGMGTGSVAFCDPFSILGVPALSLPMLALDGLPFGAQVTGFHRHDRTLISHGLSLMERSRL